jgi:hypothetical protein
MTTFFIFTAVKTSNLKQTLPKFAVRRSMRYDAIDLIPSTLRPDQPTANQRTRLAGSGLVSSSRRLLNRNQISLFHFKDSNKTAETLTNEPGRSQISKIYGLVACPIAGEVSSNH